VLCITECVQGGYLKIREVWSCQLRSFGKAALETEAVDASHKISQPFILHIHVHEVYMYSPPRLASRNYQPRGTGASHALPHTVYHGIYLCTNRGMAIGETTARPAHPDPRRARHNADVEAYDLHGCLYDRHVHSTSSSRTPPTQRRHPYAATPFPTRPRRLPSSSPVASSSVGNRCYWLLHARPYLGHRYRQTPPLKQSRVI